MEDSTTTVAEPVPDSKNEVPNETTTGNEIVTNGDVAKDESGVVLEGQESDDSKNTTIEVKSENESCEVNDDARSLDLDSLPAADEHVNAAGSDSGVEGCGRGLSSGGGSRSCASSVVSCGSGCGSESSSVNGAPPRPRRRVNVTVPDTKRASPLGTSTPRPATAPRGPNLATRERARSREKPAVPEKPRPLTPKPKIRPDLPNLVRESPALRAKPTKTSAARCKTPSSPIDDKRWPANSQRFSSIADVNATRVAADKYGTLPRRRRDASCDPEGSPRHDTNPPIARRPAMTRSASTRSTTKMRVRIYAEKVSQTVLVGTDIESAFAGILPNIESRVEVSRCHRGVQANSRDVELSRLMAAVSAAEAAAAEERQRREQAESQLANERAARLAAIAELERNSQRLLELAGAGAGAGADGCLRALEEQLRAASELAARQRADIDGLTARCDRLQLEASTNRESSRQLQARLAEAEREASEMQDFLTAETAALGDSLREAEAELATANAELDKRRVECRQLVRMCEQRRQEALSWAARARGGAGGGVGGAARALEGCAARLRHVTLAVLRANAGAGGGHLAEYGSLPTVFHNDVYSRSDSGEPQTPEEPRGLLAAVVKALRLGPAPSVPTAPTVPSVPVAPPSPTDERSRASDDNSADLLDSETEPCLVTDPDCLEEWWSGAEGPAWSADELSPDRENGHDDGESASERDSLRNLSAAIAHRHRSEAEDWERGSLLDKVAAVEGRVSELLRALRLAATANGGDGDCTRLATALKEKIDISERSAADAVVKKLAELDVSKHMLDQYRNSVEMLKNSSGQGEEDELQLIEEELSTCGESERRQIYEVLDSALTALASQPRLVRAWPRLADIHHRLERLAFAIATPPPVNTVPAAPVHTTA